MLQITPSAARRVVELAGRPENASYTDPGLRVRVVGGGCAGLSYEMEFSDGPQENDEILVVDGARIFVDRKSVPLLDLVTLDFKRTMMNAAFEFRNPVALSTCGCGSSFSV
jgi:iron-sulfur cluster assembly accessory protein